MCMCVGSERDRGCKGVCLVYLRFCDVLNEPFAVSVSVRRCSQGQAGRGVVAPFPSAPAASQTAPAPAGPRHPLPGPAQAAHRTAAFYSGGFRCARSCIKGVHAVMENKEKKRKVMECDSFCT